MTLAKAGCEIDEVMRFAGHKNVATTLRYLGWGAGAAVQHKKSFEATVVLGEGVVLMEQRRAQVAAAAEAAAAVAIREENPAALVASV